MLLGLDNRGCSNVYPSVPGRPVSRDGVGLRSFATFSLQVHRSVTDAIMFSSLFSTSALDSGKDCGEVDLAVDRFVSVVNRPFVIDPLSIRELSDIHKGRRV
jgi:hypothetical protein